MSDTYLSAVIRFAINQARAQFISDQQINEFALNRAGVDRQYALQWRSYNNWSLSQNKMVLINPRFGDKVHTLGYSLHAQGSVVQDSLSTYPIIEADTSVLGATVKLGTDQTANPIFAVGKTVQIQLRNPQNENGVFTVVSTLWDGSEMGIILLSIDGYTPDLHPLAATMGFIDQLDSRDKASGGQIDMWGAPVPFKAICIDVLSYLLLHKAQEIGDYEGRPSHYVIEDLGKQLSRFRGVVGFG